MKHGRRFLGGLLLLLLGWTIGCASGPDRRAGAEADAFTFFVIGDPQINISRWGTAGLERTISAMNDLPGQPFPHGGAAEEPRGVLVLGDLVDDLGESRNWDLYKEFFHPLGEARLRFPAYSGAGNHDLDTRGGDGGWSYVQRELMERNQVRPGTVYLDGNAYHYSWDWGDYHFVNLNVFPGSVPRPVYDNPAAWNDPKGALDFLRSDLESRVGRSRRPVVLMWHYGLRGWGLEKWWVPEDLEALRDVIEPYNVTLILHGHEHRYERYTWEGYDVIMAPAPQIDRQEGEEDSRPRGFLVVRASRDRIETAYHGPGGWEDAWTKLVKK